MLVAIIVGLVVVLAAMAYFTGSSNQGSGSIDQARAEKVMSEIKLMPQVFKFYKLYSENQSWRDVSVATLVENGTISKDDIIVFQDDDNSTGITKVDPTLYYSEGYDYPPVVDEDVVYLKSKVMDDVYYHIDYDNGAFVDDGLSVAIIIKKDAKPQFKKALDSRSHVFKNLFNNDLDFDTGEERPNDGVFITVFR